VSSTIGDYAVAERLEHLGPEHPRPPGHRGDHVKLEEAAPADETGGPGETASPGPPCVPQSPVVTASRPGLPNVLYETTRGPRDARSACPQ